MEIASNAASPTPKATETPVPKTPEPTETPYEGLLIAEFAKSFEGYKYVYSGKNPETGFDCSGLVFYVYRQFGYRLSRVASDQARNGEHVDPEDLLPGDILCFSSGGSIGHVGLYLGDGTFIHAMDSAHGVVITDLEDWLETRNLEARRIVGCVQKLTEEEIRRAEADEEELMERKRQEDELKRQQEEAERKAAEEEAKRLAEETEPSPNPDRLTIIDDPSLRYKDDPVPEDPEPETPETPESPPSDTQPEAPEQPQSPPDPPIEDTPVSTGSEDVQ